MNHQYKNNDTRTKERDNVRMTSVRANLHGWKYKYSRIDLKDKGKLNIDREGETENFRVDRKKMN